MFLGTYMNYLLCAIILVVLLEGSFNLIGKSLNWPLFSPPNDYEILTNSLLTTLKAFPLQFFVSSFFGSCFDAIRFTFTQKEDKI